MSKQYPFSTIADIAAMLEDVLARFVKELPAFLRVRQNLIDNAPGLADVALAKLKFPMRLLITRKMAIAHLERKINSAMTFVDDDLETVTIRVSAGNGDEPFFESQEKLPV